MSGISKYTLEPTGIWGKFAKWFWITPRSSGVPLNTIYRRKGLPSAHYKEPLTIPAQDIADNPYYKRDTRRQWPRQIVHTQQSITGLLSVGSVANPRISDGEAGTKELANIEQLKFTDLLKQDGASKEILDKTSGLPPLPGLKTYTWTLDESQGYPKEYPVRSFR